MQKRGDVYMTPWPSIKNPSSFNDHITKNSKIAIIDDTRASGNALQNVNALLEKKGIKPEQVQEFPVIRGSEAVWGKGYSISPFHKDGSTTRKLKFSNFLVYKDALDDYMSQQGIGKEPRKSKKS